MLTIAEIHF